MQTLEAQNLVARPFSLQTFRTADEIFTTAYGHSTCSGNTVSFNVRAPSSSCLMSSVVYVRFRCKLTADADMCIPRSAAAEDGRLGDLADKGWGMSKSDVFPVQQACNSLSLTLNGTTQNWRPSEGLRDLMISQVHKDALK